MPVEGSAVRRRDADEMLPAVYKELRRLAAGYLRRERPDHTLEATAIVHEAYLRLLEQRRLRCRGRTHFVASVARLMRQVLVDYARERGAGKRGGDRRRVMLTEAGSLDGGRPPDLVALDDALNALAHLDGKKVEIVELHFFGGLTFDEIAPLVGLSRRTVAREMQRARAWLYRELCSAESGREYGPRTLPANRPDPRPGARASAG